jgi:hypothetical protein
MLDNDQFAGATGLATFSAISMNWYDTSQVTTGGCPVTTLDQVFVENYNGTSGDNFQVFYTQQAATFIVPQEIPNTIGSYTVTGAPVAGLTNAQAWAQYGIAIAGAVAPADATTMSNINGLVVPT